MTAADAGATPLARKLGVKPESRVLLIAAPPAFAVPGLPSGVTLHTRPGGIPYDVVLAFCPDRRRLDARVPALVDRVGTAGSLWVAWPKKSGPGASDLDDDAVRAAGLATGLVDVKVVAVDEVWSALKFVRRLRDR